MRKELEELWQYYLIEVPLQRNENEKEKEIIRKYSKAEDNLRAKLNDEQKELLEKYDNAVCETNEISERFAFIKGIRFATRLIFESFCDD